MSVETERAPAAGAAACPCHRGADPAAEAARLRPLLEAAGGGPLRRARRALAALRVEVVRRPRPFAATAVATAAILVIFALQAFGSPRPPACGGRPCPATSIPAAAPASATAVPLTSVREATTSPPTTAPAPVSTAPPPTSPPSTAPRTTRPPRTTTTRRPTTTAATTTSTTTATTGPTTTTGQAVSAVAWEPVAR